MQRRIGRKRPKIEAVDKAHVDLALAAVAGRGVVVQRDLRRAAREDDFAAPAVQEEAVADGPADDDELGARLAQRHGEAPIRARHELQVADLHGALALRDAIQGHVARIAPRNRHPTRRT